MTSSSPLLLRAENVACRRGGRTVFTGVSLCVRPGAALVVAGPNGVGKSSLLKLLAGTLRPEAGTIERPERLAYLGHDNALKPMLTVAGNLLFWAGLTAPSRREAQARVEAAVRAVGIAPLWEVPARLLSSGQKRRAALARVLASGADLWLLDEPTVGLDAASVERLGPVFAGHRARGGMIVATSHTPLPLEDAETLTLNPSAQGRAA